MAQATYEKIYVDTPDLVRPKLVISPVQECGEREPHPAVNNGSNELPIVVVITFSSSTTLIARTIR